MKEFYKFAKANGQYDNGYLTNGKNICKYFELRPRFERGKTIWKKHHSVFGDHVRYVTNNITKPYNAIILKYDECVREMFGIS